MYIYDISTLRVNDLTFILLTWRKWLAPNNASRQQMGFNSGFKGLIIFKWYDRSGSRIQDSPLLIPRSSVTILTQFDTSPKHHSLRTTKPKQFIYASSYQCILHTSSGCEVTTLVKCSAAFIHFMLSVDQTYASRRLYASRGVETSVSDQYKT